MAHAARILLYFLFAGIGLTLIASGLMWWFEASRRLARALNTALGKTADAVVYDLGGQKAAGLDFTAGDLAIMWKTGAQGLVFAFDEIEGAEDFLAAVEFLDQGILPSVGMRSMHAWAKFRQAGATGLSMVCRSSPPSGER